MPSTNNADPIGNVDPSEQTLGVDPSERTIDGSAQAISDADNEENSAKEKDSGSGEGAMVAE